MTTDLFTELDAYIAAHLDEWVAELSALCASPASRRRGWA